MNPLGWLGSFHRQARQVRADSGVGIRTQIRQLAEVGYAQGIGRSEYFKYRLWRPELSAADRMSYISHRERRPSERLTNPRQQDEERLAKSAMVERLERAGLPTPTLLLRVWAGQPNGAAPGDLTSPVELAARLADVPAGGVVIKPEHGMQGNTILVAPSVTRDGITLLSGRWLGIQELWCYLTANGPDWRIEQWIEPDPILGRFRPGATPTLRLLTLSFPDHVAVHAATLKVPRGASGVDNLAKGNVVAAVDMATGRVGIGVEGDGQVRHSKHPDSGVPIEGVVIPHWEAVLDLARRGARAMPDSRALGWDITVTAAGPVAIEANRSWCEKLMQVPGKRGIVHGAFVRLLHDVGGAGLLSRRRRLSPEWARLEREAIADPIPT